jgi:Flp pilus assembly protein CpaB
MRQTNLIAAAAAAALILACVAGWATSDTQARVATPSTVQIDPFHVMVSAKKLPTEHIADYSFVFAD